LGCDVLVSLRLLDDSRGMNACLGGERTLAHIGRVTIRRPVEEFVEPVRDADEVSKRVVAHADLESVGVFGLELQCRYDGDQIGVAAALAQAVECALDLPRTGADG